jgi:hypothetical protein
VATELTLHSRQFVLARQAHHIGPNWKHVTVGHGWLLSHDPALTVTSTDGGFILGQSVQVEPEGQVNCAGRFCTVAYPWVLPDAAGLLNLYFGDGSEGSFVTSSPAIAKILGAQHRPSRRLIWGYGTGMNWNPLPGSPLKGIRRLLRDQSLNLSSFSASFRREATLAPLSATQSALDTLCSSLRTTTAALVNQGQLLLALTAGMDSRTLAAALLSNNVRFECVTHNFRGVKRADVTVAHAICRYLGVRHHVIDSVAAGDGPVDVWRQHTLGSYDDADNNVLFNADQYRFLQRDSILIRGGVFEVGRRYYAFRLGDFNYENATGEALFRRFESSAVDDEAIHSLDAWLQWRRDNDDGLDLMDSFYIGQRVGGWLAAAEQALDLLPGRSFHPANSLSAMRALVTPNPEDRKSGKLQKQAIAQMAPELLRFPFNPVLIREKIGNRSREFSRMARGLVPAPVKRWLRGAAGT